MASGRIKVVGYAQRIFYNDGIEYRNFSDSLVGQQFTEDGGNTLFTIGNFRITTNVEPRTSKIFNTNAFSSFYTLNDLNVTTSQSISILPSTTELELNLDKTKITNHAFFGSFKELIRVSLEGIISNWPASLYVNKYVSSTTGYTVQDYVYYPIEQYSTFKVPVNQIVNKYAINYQPSGNIISQYTSLYDLRNFTVNYAEYVISGEISECEILNFINSSGIDILSQTNDYDALTFDSDPTYTQITALTSSNYHINYLWANIGSYPDFQTEINNLISVPSGGTYTGNLIWYKPTPYFPISYGVQLSAHTRISGTGTTGITTGITVNYSAVPYSTDYIYLKIAGNPFPSASAGTYTENYHILPNKTNREEFFNSLTDLDDQLLNRLTIPPYTIVFNYKQKSDVGLILNLTKKLTWPTTDNYNIDFDSTQYIEYVTDLINLAEASDGTETNLVSRFFVSESISSFDTVSVENSPDQTSDNSDDQKMSKTLKIYGREFDEIKRYTDGLAFAHSFSYDKKNNAPDGIIKLVANTLGWELAQSIVDNDILAAYLTANTSSYSGQTVGLTPIQSEMEFWRRLIINSPWIWKSKGTRKAIEFLFKIIGTPKGMLSFSEYVYVADNPINMDLFLRILNSQGLTNLNLGESYVFKVTYSLSTKYYSKAVDSININLLLSAVASAGLTITVSSFNSNLYEFNPLTLRQKLLFEEIMDENGILPEDTSVLDALWVDELGYPKALRNTPDMYFQKGGLWYRETGGQNAIIDILAGNNPHLGPYDRGYAYLANFERLLSDFTATTILNNIVTTGTTNIFLNYNSGTLDDLTESEQTIHCELVDENNNPTNCVTLEKSIIPNPFAVDRMTDCGCLLAVQDDALKFDFKCKQTENKSTDLTCASFTKDNVAVNEKGYFGFIVNGETIFDLDVLGNEIGINGVECCISRGFHVLEVEYNRTLIKVCSVRSPY